MMTIALTDAFGTNTMPCYIQ